MDRTLSDPLIGRLLDGRYAVGRRLARGGMATVYEAVDTRLERTVAIKVMHDGLAADPEFVSRFIREARSAARLSHPNIVAVYDQGSDGDVTFLAMEYVDGVTLRDVMRQRGSLAPDDALQIMEQILGALAAAHRGGIIHRDVKPENVLLTTDGRVKVADFGLARAVSGTASVSTLTGSVIIGTVAYLSPELVERGIADARSDVYAAGIVLFEMLTGSKPYVGDSPIQVAFRHVHEIVPAPSTLVPGLRPEVDTLVGRATARDPELRPRDAGEFLDAVTRVREGRPLFLDPLVDRADEDDATVRTDRRSTPEPSHTLVVPRTTPVFPSADPADAVRPISPPAVAPAALTAEPPLVPPSLRRSRRRGWITFFIIVVLGIALLLGSYWWAVGRYTDTPNVLHKTQAQAAEILTRAGLRPAVEMEFNETIAPDTVISTDPGPNAKVLGGGAVTLVVSKGPERYAVPNVVRLTVAAATKAIEALPLQVSSTVTEEYSGSIGKGLVIHTLPPIGQKSAKRGSTVSLFVSKGPAPVPVPTVVGKTLAEAQGLLTAADMTETHDATAFSETVPEGSVISQTPQDTTALPGSVVVLVISKGPELFQVPDVEKKTRADAIAVLESAPGGFKVSVVYSLPSWLRTDYVLQQDPAPGTQLRRGSTVTIYVV